MDTCLCVGLCAPDLLRKERNLSGLMPISHETTAKSDRPGFRRERERDDIWTCRGNTGAQKILRGNSCATTLTFIRVNAVSEDHAI